MGAQKQQSKEITIVSDFPISKISERVFLLGEIDVNNEFLLKFCEILDLGSKFVPSIFNKHSNFLHFFLNNLDCNLLNFNKFLFFSKQKFLKNNINPNNDPAYHKSFLYHLNRMNLKQKKLNIPLQHETLVLRQYMIKTLAQKPFNSFLNLNEEQIFTLENFLRGKNFIVSQCDKNVGFAVLSKNLYNKLCDDHLNSNDTTYEKLLNNPLKNTRVSILNSIKNLNNNNHISDKLFRHLTLENCKLGKFKIQPKIHKSKFSIRPIVASINHPTTKISFVVDFLLQPIVTKQNTYLKDSQNLIQKYDEFGFDDTDSLEIGTADFESLYQNIISTNAIPKICSFLESIHFGNEHIDIYAIKVFLELIFNHNVFKYGDKYYRQIIGIAMGCICGPTVANLYLYICEKNWVALNNLPLYKRFIDDIAYVSKKGLNQSELTSNFENLKLNFYINDTVPFLDLNISFDKLKNKLKFSLFIKPTNTFQYLYFNSNHPKHIFKNIPKSLFIRIRRICSEDIEYYFFSRSLFGQLIKRGYEEKFLFKIMFQIGRLNRHTLLEYKSRQNTDDQFSIRLCMSFDHNYLDLKKDLNSCFEILREDFKWLSNYKLNFTNSILPNLKKLLIDNCYFKYNKDYFTRKCSRLNCKVCNFIYKVSYLKIGNFMLPLKCNSNCNSLGIIYIIKCLKCNVFYVGESEFSSHIRIAQHLNDIDSFVPFGIQNFEITKIVKSNVNYHRPKRLQKRRSFHMCIFKPRKRVTEVSEHFNLKGHDKINHFRFVIFDKNISEKELRLSVETDLMNLILNFGKILNKKVPNFKFIKKLCFS